MSRWHTMLHRIENLEQESDPMPLRVSSFLPKPKPPAIDVPLQAPAPTTNNSTDQEPGP